LEVVIIGLELVIIKVKGFEVVFSLKLCCCRLGFEVLILTTHLIFGFKVVLLKIVCFCFIFGLGVVAINSVFGFVVFGFIFGLVVVVINALSAFVALGFIFGFGVVEVVEINRVFGFVSLTFWFDVEIVEINPEVFEVICKRKNIYIISAMSLSC
jgi:hypothetical protein